MLLGAAKERGAAGVLAGVAAGKSDLGVAVGAGVAPKMGTEVGGGAEGAEKAGVGAATAARGAAAIGAGEGESKSAFGAEKLLSATGVGGAGDALATVARTSGGEIGLGGGGGVYLRGAGS